MVSFWIEGKEGDGYYVEPLNDLEIDSQGGKVRRDESNKVKS